jgi:hypothetical protein
MQHRLSLEPALQRLHQRLEADPHNPHTYVQRGMTYFKINTVQIKATASQKGRVGRGQP